MSLFDLCMRGRSHQSDTRTLLGVPCDAARMTPGGIAPFDGELLHQRFPPLGSHMLRTPLQSGEVSHRRDGAIGQDLERRHMINSVRGLLRMLDDDEAILSDGYARRGVHDDEEGNGGIDEGEAYVGYSDSNLLARQ